MAIGLGAAAAVTTNLTANGTTASHAIPASVEGLLPVCYLTIDPSRNLALSGWTDRSHGIVAGDGSTLGIIWKAAAGEASPVVFNYNSGTGQSSSVSRCFTGVDTADPFRSNNSISGNSDGTNTITIAAGVLTVLSTSWAILLIGVDNAVRNISTPDADWTTLGSNANTTVSDHTIHALYWTNPSGLTSSPATSIVMSGTRTFLWAMFELKATAGGGGGGGKPWLYYQNMRQRAAFKRNAAGIYVPDRTIVRVPQLVRRAA